MCTHTRARNLGLWLFVGLIFWFLTLLPAFAQAPAQPLSDVEVNIAGKIYHLQVVLVPNTTGYVIGPVQAPSDLTVSWTSRDSIRLIWRDNSTNETAFSVWRRQAATDWVRVAVVQPNMTVYTDTGLQENQEYFYKVRATNDLNASDWSPIVAVWTQWFPPNPANEPVITGFLNAAGQSITTALPGDTVTLVGDRFGDGGVVTFNNQTVPFLSWSETRIQIKLDGFASTWQPGTLEVWRNDGHYYATLAFAIGVPPTSTGTPPPTPPPIPTPDPTPTPMPTPTPTPTPGSLTFGGYRDGSRNPTTQTPALANLVIIGSGWGSVQPVVTIGGLAATVTGWLPQEIDVTVPAAAAGLTIVTINGQVDPYPLTISNPQPPALPPQ